MRQNERRSSSRQLAEQRQDLGGFQRAVRRAAAFARGGGRLHLPPQQLFQLRDLPVSASGAALCG